MESATTIPLPSLPLPQEAVEILRPKSDPDIVNWTEQTFVLSKKSEALGGSWSREYVPFLLEPMGWFTDEFTEQIDIQAAMQVGKSVFVGACLNYIIAIRPGPAMVVMPTRDTLERRFEARLKPMFEENPILLRHLGGDINNFNIGKLTMLDNMPLYMGWAGSTVILSDVSLRFGFIDEAALDSGWSDDIDYITLFKRRFRAFKGRYKLALTSSPKAKGSRFDAEYESGDKCQWWAKCVHCHRSHPMEFEHVRIQKEAAGHFFPPDAYRGDQSVLPPEWRDRGALAHYICPKCGTRWTEYQRWQSVRAGRWSPADSVVNDACEIVTPSGERFEHVPPRRHHSVRAPSWLVHPSTTDIGDITAGFAAAQTAIKTGDTTLLRDWKNNEAAEAWQETQKKTDIDELKPHIGGYESGWIPPGVQSLTLAFDVMGDYLWWALVGWGYMFEAWLIESNRIICGDTEKSKNIIGHVRDLSMRSWRMKPDARWAFYPAVTTIDCGFNYDTVIDVARTLTMEGLPVVPVRGRDSVRNHTMARARVEGPTELYRYDLNTDMIKNRLHREMFVTDTPGPGFFHLPQGLSLEILQHLTSEECGIDPKTGKGRWKVKAGSLANHAWDCTVYATAGAEIVGVGEMGTYEDFVKNVLTPAPTPAIEHTKTTRKIRTQY
jgi:phage terminase large subunit GpA-like protein